MPRMQTRQVDVRRLELRPTILRAANAYVAQRHRHLKPVRGCICVVSVVNGEGICGVAIVGRPVARLLQDGYTAEVTRCCTDGTPNACSMLYGAAWRSVRALGYRRLTTYSLPEEGGASLRAAGSAVGCALDPPVTDRGAVLSADRVVAGRRCLIVPVRLARPDTPVRCRCASAEKGCTARPSLSRRSAGRCCNGPARRRPGGAR